MADKLLILGAAMAHANKSYNIGSSITKAIDKSLKGYVGMVKAQQKRIDAAGILTQAYLDKLPEDPKIDLLDENMIGMFTSELNDIRSQMADKRNELTINNHKYKPGTQAYTDITNEIKKLEKTLNVRHEEAKNLQMAKANWIKEHPNISETWKIFNADKYIALSQMLEPEKLDYKASRDKDGKLILSTTVDGKKIDIKVDELDDWEQYPLPEIVEINKYFELAQTSGKQG